MGLWEDVKGVMRSVTEWVGLGNGEYTRRHNAEEAQKQRDFEREMSNTAYQRAVDDMEKAGINPAMALSNGGPGASTPNGATGSSSPTGGNGLGQIASVINSAANMAHVMNNDKSKSNNMSVGDTVNLINTVAKLL